MPRTPGRLTLIIRRDRTPGRTDSEGTQNARISMAKTLISIEPALAQ
jgi:hypothetical protein